MRTYKAFISYSWADQEWARWLHHALETYRPPKGVADGRTLHPIFKDREEEAAGGSIGEAIAAALAASEYLIVICSPRSAASPWVNREIAWFKTHKDKGRILALIVDGEPGAARIDGREALECFPRALTHAVSADLQSTDEMADEPLAADARPEGDGKRSARLKLAAALLGVGLDELVRRDERRRTLRRRIVTGASLSLAALMSVLAFVALDQRNAALSAQKQAQAAQADAEFQRDEAQGLVEFMLTDLRKRLDAVGRLDVLDAVAKRLNESYARQALSKLDADALGRRARVQLLLGEVENTRGNLDAALAQYKEAAASTGELLNRNPGKPQQIFDHAQSIFWVGYIAWQRGDAAEAKKYFTQYKDYADQLAAIDPDNEDWQAEVDYANSNLGTLALDQGEAAEAVEYFERSLDVSKELADAQPNDKERMLALSQSYSWLALAQERVGAFGAAGKSLASEKVILDALVNYDARNSSAAAKALVNARGRARLALASGDSSKAISLLFELAEHQKYLAASDPKNTNSLSYYAFSLIDLGEAQLAAGLIKDAGKTSTIAIEVANRLVAIDPSVVQWRTSAAGIALRLAANVKISEGDYNNALTTIDIAEQDIVEKFGKQSNHRDMSAFAGSLATLKARAYSRLGDIANAKKLAEEAIATLELAHALADPGVARWMVEAFLIADAPVEAAQLATMLARSGYRHPEFVALLKANPALQAATGDIMMQKNAQQ